MPQAPIIIPVKLLSNPDGSLRTTNPQGDFNPLPSALMVDRAAYSAAQGSLTGLIQGTAGFGIDLRGAWLTGTEAATCTFAVRTISGDLVGTHNWTITGSLFAQNLTMSSVGSGVLEVIAVDSRGNELSYGQFTWNVIAAVAGTDTSPPTVPTSLIATGTAVAGKITGTFDASSDRYDNATPPTGVAHYDVYLDGVSNQTITAAAGPSLQMIGTSLGNSTPSANFSQSAGTVTMQAAGAGIHAVVADECLFFGVSFSGDFSLTVKVGAFTSATPYSTAGVMVRETLAQGAVSHAAYMQPSSPGLGWQVKTRTVTGAKSANVASVSGKTSGWIKLVRIGNSFAVSYSDDGNTFNPITTSNIAMAQTAQVGIFLSSQNPGVPCTATFSEVNLTSSPALSFQITTTGTHTVTVRAVDVHGNASAFCLGAQATSTASAPVTQGALKQHGGNYLYLDRNANTASKLARMQTFADADTNNIGFQDITFWGKFENPNVPGDYSGNWDASGDSGFKYIDKMLARCRAVRPGKPMRFMWNMSAYGFYGINESSTKWPGSFAPNYLGGNQYGDNSNIENSGQWGGIWVNTVTQTTKTGGNVGYFYKWWTGPVMDRMIALMNAYGARYDNPNPALNAPNSDLFEMVSFTNESATPLFTSYTDAQAMAQYKRYFPAMRAAWPTTQCRFWGNYMQDPTFFYQVWDLCAASFITGGGADLCNEVAVSGHGSKARVIPADVTFRGLSATSPYVPVTGRTNYVGKLGYVGEIEGDEEGPRSAGPNNDYAGPANTGNNFWADYFAHGNDQGCTYITMFDNGFTGNNDKRFAGKLASQPSHPDAQDALSSLGSGTTVNGANMGTTLLFKNTYPSLYPTS